MFFIAAVSASLLAADTTPKVSAERQKAIADANAENQSASYLSEIARLKQELARANVRIAVLESCGEAGIKPADCEIGADYTIKKRAEVPKADAPKK